MIVEGRIIVVQEQRFRLLTDGGQTYLLTLGRGAPLDTEQLADLKEARARVVVNYAGEPNLAGGIARSVERADAGAIEGMSGGSTHSP